MCSYILSYTTNGIYLFSFVLFCFFLCFALFFVYVYFGLCISEQCSGLIANKIQTERQFLRSSGLIPK